MERRPLNTCALGVTSRIVVLTYQHLGDFILPRCSKPRGCFGQWLAHLVRDDGLEPPTPTCKDGALPTELIAHGPACACGWHQIHDVLRREPVNGRAHIESNAGSYREQCGLQCSTPPNAGTAKPVVGGVGVEPTHPEGTDLQSAAPLRLRRPPK